MVSNLPHLRHSRRKLRRCTGLGLLAGAFAFLAPVSVPFSGSLNQTATSWVASAHAQTAGTSLAGLPDVGENEKMLVESDELIYDNQNETVTASGNVQIYYGPYTLQADKVVYRQQTDRLIAVGNVRVTEPDGNVIYAQSTDLSENFRDGFLRSLTVESSDNTTISASTAERFEDRTTVFNRGVYTACEKCESDPQKPPLWQVKAVRVIHDQQTKTIFFEHASLEFFGLPIAYFPFLSTPDPTVKRRTGFLPPRFRASERIGYGVETPFFINIAPNKDITLSPLWSTRQGVVPRAQWRHRTSTGAYAIEGAFVHQLDPEADNPNNPGDDKDFRGYLRTRGKFAINKRWHYGWDATYVTDTGFLKSYGIDGESRLVSTAFLIGQTERNRFETSIFGFKRLNAFSFDQGVLPGVLPVVDHNYRLDRSVLGGEVGIDTNFYNTVRGNIDNSRLESAISQAGLTTDDYADTTRLVSEVYWRRQMIDSLGQVFTPFASLRGDLFVTDGGYNASRRTFTDTRIPAEFDEWLPRIYDNETEARVIPTLGVEYRVPFAATNSWGTHTIEPIAQVFYRPNTHSNQNDLLNEDALSLVFDTTSLFDRDKFSGYDRVETGLRANAGVRYTSNFRNGGSAQFSLGRSFHLAGDNPFPQDSGLEEDTSDYVGSAALDLSPSFKISAAARLNGDTLDFERSEIVGTASHGRLSTRVTFAHIREQPALGAISDSQQLYGQASLRLNQEWSVSGYSRYDFEIGDITTNGIGLSYADECFTFGLNYSETFSTNGETSRAVSFTLSLRTLGAIGSSSSEVADNGDF